MAAPVTQTLALLVTEGLKKSGISSPSTAQQTRGEDQYMEEIKADISILARDLTSLYTAAYTPTVIGKNRYANPTDYGIKMTMTLLYGQNRGTAQSGTASSLTLAANETVSEDFIIGKNIFISSGTGVGSYSQDTSYSTSTKIAGVAPDFTSTPGASGYIIVDVEYEVREQPVWGLDKGRNSISKARPFNFYPIGDSNDGEFILIPTPDKVYGLQMRYYADLQELDLTSTLLSTLYNKWRNLWILGVAAKQLESDVSDRAPQAMQRYEAYLNGLVQRERFGFNMSNLQMTTGN